MLGVSVLIVSSGSNTENVFANHAPTAMEFSKINFSHNASTHAKGVLSKNLAGWKPLP